MTWMLVIMLCIGALVGLVPAMVGHCDPVVVDRLNNLAVAIVSGTLALASTQVNQDRRRSTDRPNQRQLPPTDES